MTDLIGFAQIAEIANVKVDTVRKWEKWHDDFPERRPSPETSVRFDRAEVTAWLAKPRPNGRPRKDAL